MSRGKLANINAAALVLCAAGALSVTLPSTAFAQTSAPSATPPPPVQSESQARPRAGQPSQSGAADAQADLSITARVTARELRFEKVPNPTVEFTGQPRRETVWEAERENLPDRVQPGVTYRNIGITLRITSVFADIDRIVAEALGEIPSSDGAQPQNATSEQPAAPSSTTEKLAPQTGAQRISASDSSPAKATAANATRRTRPARKGRGN
ncbi:MAG: hypothetical protein H7Z38_18955 [Rubrivivax sp.]|nr:hypothetical protein [Pyrinomonadaceae bacterium]